MTAKQRTKAIASFKKELVARGWVADRFGNYLSSDYRVKITAQLYKLERKVDKKWINISAFPLNQLVEGCAPPTPAVAEAPAKPRKIRKVVREVKLNPHLCLPGIGKSMIVSPREAESVRGPLKVAVSLDEASQKRIDAMAFKQVQTNSRMDKMDQTLARLESLVGAMAGMVEGELHRIKARPVLETAPLFYPKMFNRIIHRLRKKSIDVQIEDIHEGVRRKRIFRCTDWTRVEHLMAYRTLTDGIEELEVRPTVRRTRKGKAPAKKQGPAKRTKTLADVRHEMERDGIKNSIIPSEAGAKFAYHDKQADAMQQAVNRSREKAEKVIIKLCSPGCAFEGAKDAQLLDALQENGFDSQVAFYAAMNCGRISDPKLIKKHSPKVRVKVGDASNDY